MNKLQRNIIKFKINKSNKLNNKRGAELVESILMVGVAISLIVIVFYPQITSLMSTGFQSLEVWFKDALSSIGQPIV
jgi:hypothetical protein